MKFATIAALALGVYAQPSAQDFAQDLKYEAELAKEQVVANFEQELYNEGGIPTDFCKDGLRHTVATRPTAKAYQPQGDFLDGWPGAQDWLAAQVDMYGFKKPLNLYNDVPPYLHLYNINTVACLPKDADVSKYTSVADLDKGTETYDQHQEFTVNRQVELVRDIYEYGKLGHGPKQINAFLEARGIKQDPKLVTELAPRQKEWEKIREQMNQARKEAEPQVPEDTSKFSVTKLNEGTGTESPKKGQTIKAHYTGTLLDGTKFDSSLDRGRPLEYPHGTGTVIKCWDEAFSQLVKGQKAILICPPDYAYGDRAMGKIPSQATLKFEVELVDF